MARTPQPIRHLNATQLEIEFDLDADEQEGAPSELREVTSRIPEQMNAPIITIITDHRLIRIPGRMIEKTAPIAGLSQYLMEQFRLVISDLEGQADRRTIAAFREAEALLQDWSISKLLAFGAHLYLIESLARPLKQELMEPAAQRLDVAIQNSRRFINSFEEWHEYVKQSILFEVEIGNSVTEITNIAENAAGSLADRQDSVDSQIPTLLNEYIGTIAKKESPQAITVGIMSVLRSITNISISFTEYVVNSARNGYKYLIKDGHIVKMLETICRFLPHVLRLATINPSYSWLLSYSDEVRATCEEGRRMGFWK